MLASAHWTRWSLLKVKLALLQERAVPRMHEQETRNPTWKILTEWQMKNGRTSHYRKLEQSRTTLSRRWQRYRKDRRTPWIQASTTVEKKNMTKQSSEPDAEQWSSWSSSTWLRSSRCLWWDSSSSQTATIRTTFLIWCPSTRLEHKLKNKLRTTCCESTQIV